MKLKDLEKMLRELGWYNTGKGSKHSKWSNGRDSIAVPRHKEINERTAIGILKSAKQSNTMKTTEQEKP